MFNTRNLIIFGAVAAVLLGWFGISTVMKKSDGSQIEMAEDVAETEMTVDIGSLYKQAHGYMENGKLLEAKRIYKRIYSDYPDYEGIEDVQKDLEKINMDLIFSNTPTDNSIIHEVGSGDTLGKLAQKYNTTVEHIKISNNLKTDIIRIGQKLKIWNGKFNIHVDKSQNILILRNKDEVIKVYDVSTGSNNSTPVGVFKVTSKLIDPVWFNKGVVVPPESPANVLGTRWLGFDIPGYGIHGTVEPDKIGEQVTAGCVRMRNEEVEELYSIIPMGTEVTVVN